MSMSSGRMQTSRRQREVMQAPMRRLPHRLELHAPVTDGTGAKDGLIATALSWLVPSSTGWATSWSLMQHEGPVSRRRFLH